MIIKLSKEAINQKVVKINELSPGDCFELGRQYFVLCAGTTFSSNKGQNKRYPCHSLTNSDNTHLDGEFTVKQVSITILVSEDEDSEEKVNDDTSL